MTATPANAAKTAIKSMIKKGYVLHLDPDYLLLTYGDITTGKMPRNTIGPRYAMCVGDEGEATFWVLLSSQDNDHKQAIPEKAKVGAWAGNGTASFFAKDGLWVMTRDMAVEAHVQVNAIRSTYKHNSVKVDLISPWPAIPCTYPKNFTPLKHSAPTYASQDQPMASKTPKPEDLLFHDKGAGIQVPPIPKPEPVAALDREAISARAAKLLINPRLTDAEVQTLIGELERRIIGLLLGE